MGYRLIQERAFLAIPDYLFAMMQLTEINSICNLGVQSYIS
jgi:hypothetical protein